MKLNLKNLSKLLPFKSKPAKSPVAKTSATAPQQPAKPPAAATPAPKPAPPAPQPPAPAKPSAPMPKPSELLDSIVKFLRQYLVCDDHYLTVLALWIAHTWSFQHFQTATYLEFRSPQSHSGKSTCLQLLAMLSADPWLASGPDPWTVVRKLLTDQRCLAPGKSVQYPAPRTILLDNCDHTFGRSERQGLLGMLNSGVSPGARYAFGNSEYCLFGPKAFAATAPLPKSLAARCIPILLLRKKQGDTVARLTPEAAASTAGNIAAWLRQWARDFGPALAQAAQRAPARIPSDLVLPEQVLTEPLIHVADMVGGAWPDRARAAMSVTFKAPPSDLSLLVLCDIRAWFHAQDNPEHLLSRDLLDSLASQHNRPWSDWPRNSGRLLGGLLKPFEITATSIKLPSGKVNRGYKRAAFQDAWERYLPPIPASSAT